MKTRDFLAKLQDDKIVAAIAQAEKKTSGEIRVFISRKPVQAPVTVAQAHFLEMGMTHTRERNAVLIFVAPRSHKFAVIGDTGVHARCGDAFWRLLADEMTEHFRKGQFEEGIVHAINKAGELLGQHFPRRRDDSNELPDAVERD